MTNITPFTKIFVLISVSIFFGNSCKWNLEFIPEPFICGDIVLDSRDSMDYRTKTFGTQCWMLDNMKIGTKLTVGESTKNGEFEYYCLPTLLLPDCDRGGLYKWEELFEQDGICPDGWHVPNKEEFKDLLKYISNSGDSVLNSPISEDFIEDFNITIAGFLSSDKTNPMKNMSKSALWSSDEDHLKPGHAYVLWMNLNVDNGDNLSVNVFSTNPIQLDISKQARIYTRCVQN